MNRIHLIVETTELIVEITDTNSKFYESFQDHNSFIIHNKNACLLIIFADHQQRLSAPLVCRTMHILKVS